MAEPALDIEVDEATGEWRVDGMPMILVPRHFLVNNHVAVEEAIGVETFSAAGPAMTSTRRISSEAYATEERLSEAKMARPVTLDSRSCRACAVESG